MTPEGDVTIEREEEPVRGTLTGPALRNIASPPGYSRVRDAIRDDIVDGYFGDESRLVISALCTRYGVTAPPIREALSRLEVEGLIVLNPNRGARVRAIDEAFVTEIFEIRMSLEPEMVWRIAPIATASDIRDLDELEAKFEAAVLAKDPQNVSNFNRSFHLRIYEINPNREALRILGHQDALIRTLRNRYGYQAERVEEIIKEHRALVRAIEAHDADKARAIERIHIEHSLADILRLMRGAKAR
jgi:DNA-binding GntR family transcriptional regulator